MDKEKDPREIETTPDFFKEVISAINKQYAELTITEVEGKCPYGHKEGEKFRISAMNSDGLCGSLYAAIEPSVFTLDYGGNYPWEHKTKYFKYACPEMGKVKVEVRHKEKEDIRVLKTKKPAVDMTGKGYAGIDKYRIFVEILGIERHCTWGHRVGHKFEIDPFNVGNVCGCLYWSAYRFMNVLFEGASLPWEAEENIIHGMCPDIHNQVIYRLIREERK
ncbi:MAG: TIGR04076 family protein [Candidatus Schekmanbacteria bacterium]|nr:MAG: TIGR04076 family protein [Candidatus Schekmanbacteria bacterium]